MKIKCLLFLFILVGCTNNLKPELHLKAHSSTTQKEVQNIIDSFKSEYAAAKSTQQKENIVDKYNLKLSNFLSNNIIDSMNVHVDSVIKNGLTITTKFHCNKDIIFQYGLTFKDSMTSHWDSIYQFMKGLKIGSDTIINFSYMGSHQLSNPDDTTLATLKIFAFPIPNNSHGH